MSFVTCWTTTYNWTTSPPDLILEIQSFPQYFTRGNYEIQDLILGKNAFVLNKHITPWKFIGLLVASCEHFSIFLMVFCCVGLLFLLGIFCTGHSFPALFMQIILHWKLCTLKWFLYSAIATSWWVY